MSVTIQEANAAIGSMDSAYFGIILKGFYIPKRTSAVITADYLLKVMTDKVFRIKQSEVKLGQLLDKASSQQLWIYFQGIQIGKPWGFDQFHLPDKIWMINVLYTLQPNHIIFKNSIPECISLLSQDEVKIIQSFNTSIGRQRQGRFFKRSKIQTNSFKKQIELRKELKKQNTIIQKKKQIQSLNSQVESLINNQFQEEI